MRSWLVDLATGGVDVATYYGGTRSERGRALALNPAGRLVFAGQTMSAEHAGAPRGAARARGGNRDTFVVQLDPPYTAVTYATYLGGSNNDEGMGVAIDSSAASSSPAPPSYPVARHAGRVRRVRLRRVERQRRRRQRRRRHDDAWETQYGPDPATNDAAADPDGDGVTQPRRSCRNNTHPTGFFTRYLAEGATGTFFDSGSRCSTRRGPGHRAPALPARSGAELQQLLPLPPALAARRSTRRRSPASRATSFSTVIESDQSVVVDRTMTWDGTGIGSHAETSIEAGVDTWYLAEGATGGTFDLYYLLQNPNPAAASVTHHLPAALGAPLVEDLHRRPAQPAHRQRRQRALRAVRRRHALATDVSAHDRIDQRHADPGRARDVHDVAGTAVRRGAQQRRHHDAGDELVPGRRRDRHVLRPLHPAREPDDDADDGRDHLPADRRADDHAAVRAAGPEPPDDLRRHQPGLADVARRPSCARSMPASRSSSSVRCGGPDGNWTEAHNSAGALVTSPRWALAEGEFGGARAPPDLRAPRQHVAFAATSA